MAFIEFVTPDQASEEACSMYERQAGFFGYLPNYATVFGHRPQIMSLWASLQAGIRANMAPRLYELVTLAAAYELRSTYCCLAHSKKLLQTFSKEEICSIVDRDGEGVLPPAEVAAVRHARLVARCADQVRQEDVDQLRRLGIHDAEIFDITAAAAARAFFTKLVDGLGAQPDDEYAELDAALLETMAVGRSVATPQS